MKSLQVGLLGVLLFLVGMPAASAQWYDLQYLLYDIFGWGYYSDSGFVLLKLGIFVVLFAFLQMALRRIFTDNMAAGNVVALVISLISVIFIPPEFIENIGSISGVIGVLIVVGAILILPYVLLSAAGFPNRWLYAIILIVELFALQALAQNAYYYNPVLDYLFAALRDISFWEMIGIAVLIILAVVGVSHFRRQPAAVGGGGHP